MSGICLRLCQAVNTVHPSNLRMATSGHHGHDVPIIHGRVAYSITEGRHSKYKKGVNASDLPFLTESEGLKSENTSHAVLEFTWCRNEANQDPHSLKILLRTSPFELREIISTSCSGWLAGACSNYYLSIWPRNDCWFRT
jgi:hypothetical protein